MCRLSECELAPWRGSPRPWGAAGDPLFGLSFLHSVLVAILSQVSRSSMRDMWNSIMSVVSGFVNPDLLICRVTDPTHPVRFATPPNESCFTVVYAGKEPIRPSKDRRILGEYTGHIRQGKANEHR